MKNIYSKYYENLFDLLKIPVEIKDEILKINNEFGTINNFNIENIKKFHKKNSIVTQMVSSNFNEIKETKTDFFRNSLNDVYKFVENIEDVVFETQKKERFHPLSSDNLTKKITKRIKLFFKYLMWLPIIFTNLFRKKNNKKELKYQKHKIKKSKIAELVFVNYFLRKKHILLVKTLDKRQDLFDIVKEIDEIIKTDYLSNKTKNKKLIDEKIKEFDNELTEHKNLLTNNFNRTFDDLNKKYESLCLKFGTFEFPNRKIKKNKVAKRTNKLLKNQSLIYNNYGHTTYGLFEHWRLKHNVQEFLFDILYSFYKGSENFGKNTKIIQKSCNKIVNIISEVISDIEINKKNISAIISKKIEENLSKTIVPEFINQTSKSNLSNSYDLIVDEIVDNYNKLQLNYTLPKVPNNKLPIPKKHLKTINIEHIIQEIFEEYIQSKLILKKKTTILEIQKRVSTIDETDHVINYAIEFYQNQDELTEELRFKEFFDGIKRALSKTQKCSENITKLKTDTDEYFIKTSTNFNNNLLKATSPNKIFVYEKNRIRKLKTKKIKNNLLFVFHITNNYTKKTIIILKKLLVNFKHYYNKFRKILGINPDETKITGEISNYLSDTQKSISNLPLIYQKLFAIKPLTNERFYIPADKVLSDLENAYSNWKKSNIASTCIVGESGSGMTTTINYFVKNSHFDYSINTYDVLKTTTTEDDFIKFLKTIFVDYNFKNINQLVTKINKNRKKRIIIIENIQQLFLRIRGGFSNLMLLFQLISQTNSNIFWINTCSLYSWKYIDFAINSKDYYRNIINMNFEKKDKIKNIIESRHKPSGFNLIFKEPETFWKSRNYKKLNYENKQEFLKNDFFKKLNKFSQNNISMALIFWQRAVIQIEEDKFIMQYKNIDHSFLSTLSLQKIKILHTILIQRNINTTELSKIFNTTENESFMQLTVLKNDAIIIQKNNRFSINPLLYRQVVDYLKSSNFIY